MHQFREIDGVIKIPAEVRTKGTDDEQRHADSAIALLNFYAASLVDAAEIDFRATSTAGRAGQRAYADGPLARPAISPAGWGAVGGGPDTEGF